MLHILFMKLKFWRKTTNLESADRTNSEANDVRCQALLPDRQKKIRASFYALAKMHVRVQVSWMNVHVGN